MNHGRSKARALTSLALVLVFAMPLLAFASSYTSTLGYEWRVYGTTRTYTHDDMNLSATFATTNNTTGTHTVQLWRDRAWPLSNQLCGTRTLNRKGYSNVDWYDVGPANYYFYFEKAQDGVYVYTNNLSMYCN